MAFAKILYRREAGLGALSERELKKSIRVERSHYDEVNREEVIEILTYEEFITDFIEQGGQYEEAIGLLEPGSVFYTIYASYQVTVGIDKDAKRTILYDVIRSQLSLAEEYTHPNIHELGRDSWKDVAIMVLDIVLNERIGIGAAINVLEDILG